jgi:hypothetical protein
MSLSIDNLKVEELLESTGVDTSFFNPSFPIEDSAPFYPTNAAGGVSFPYTEVDTTEARANLLRLRKQIETSGTPLIDSDELDAEIREIRG